MVIKGHYIYSSQELTQSSCKISHILETQLALIVHTFIETYIEFN